HVQGDAQLDGQLDIAALSLMPGRRVTVLTVDGYAAGQLAPRQSPIFDYALHLHGNDHNLSVTGADIAALTSGLGCRHASSDRAATASCSPGLRPRCYLRPPFRCRRAWRVLATV